MVASWRKMQEPEESVEALSGQVLHLSIGCFSVLRCTRLKMPGFSQRCPLQNPRLIILSISHRGADQIWRLPNTFQAFGFRRGYVCSSWIKHDLCFVFISSNGWFVPLGGYLLPVWRRPRSQPQGVWRWSVMPLLPVPIPRCKPLRLSALIRFLSRWNEIVQGCQPQVEFCPRIFKSVQCFIANSICWMHR